MQNNNHKKKKTILKLLGFVLLITGAIFVVIGMVDFFSAMGTFEPPTKFWMLFIGFPCCAFGGMLLLLGFKREISTYVKNEATPVFNEMGRDIQPGIQSIANATRGQLDKVCPRCGRRNDHDAAFCAACANKLANVCPYCRQNNPADAAYCKSCGRTLN